MELFAYHGAEERRLSDIACRTPQIRDCSGMCHPLDSNWLAEASAICIIPYCLSARESFPWFFVFRILFKRHDPTFQVRHRGKFYYSSLSPIFHTGLSLWRVKVLVLRIRGRSVAVSWVGVGKSVLPVCVVDGIFGGSEICCASLRSRVIRAFQVSLRCLF